MFNKGKNRHPSFLKRRGNNSYKKTGISSDERNQAFGVLRVEKSNISVATHLI